EKRKRSSDPWPGRRNHRPSPKRAGDSDSPPNGRALLRRDVQPGAPERVGLVPRSPDVQELQSLEGMRDRGIDDEMACVGLEPEQGAEDEQRSAARPCLRRAGGGVFDREARLFPWKAGEGLG